MLPLLLCCHSACMSPTTPSRSVAASAGSHRDSSTEAVDVMPQGFGYSFALRTVSPRRPEAVCFPARESGGARGIEKRGRCCC